MKKIETDERHMKFRNDLEKILRRHTGHLDARELLAVSAKMVGHIIAMQDVSTVNAEMALAIVSANIEAGNREAQEAFQKASTVN